MRDGVAEVGAKAIPEQRNPMWYSAMREFRWTVANIRDKFGVPRAVAKHIQGCHPSYADACMIVRAHVALRDQVGH